MIHLWTKKGSESVDKNFEDNSDRDEINRQSLLNLLAKEWDQTGPPGIMDLSDIAGHLNISVEDVRRVIKPLFVMGAVDTDRSGFAAFLTPKGYAQLREQQSQLDH